jgi:hypothetical protein
VGVLFYPPPVFIFGQISNFIHKIELNRFQQPPEQVEPPFDQAQEKPEHRQDQLDELVQKPDLVFNNNTCGHNFDLNILKQ